MPPKPRPVNRNASTSRDTSASKPPPVAAKDAVSATVPSTSMPPPPNPAPPLGILEEEVTALSACLQNAVVRTGQVYGFYTDVKRLGIQHYAPRPPRSLMSSLGREIVKYDQLCDAMESHLLRAIAVLQRDLAREEQRLKAEEEAVTAAAAAAAAARAASPSVAAAASATTPPGSPTPSTQADPLLDGAGSMRARMSGLAGPGLASARRQSTISFSSLSRPAFPHKLDLSASALRIHPDEMIPSGLSSPVTLAPRSARASLPPDLIMAALGDATGRPVDIDLTLEGDMDGMAGPSGHAASDGQAQVDSSLGSSADKPIELDIDLDVDMQFFGDAPAGGAANANAGLFGPDGGQLKPKEEQMDIDLLADFGASGGGEDIFASLGQPSASGSGPAPPSVADLQKAATNAPSPGTILAGLAAGTSQPGDAPGTAGESFDFDMSSMASLSDNFFNGPTGEGGMDMMEIFNMGVNPPNTDGPGTSTGGGT
ncbi:hypothetical protein C8Q80DRAFT_1333973 [Daedaleopsis nitida]|nr:hypothetical protein C8Q80DRAFT_1333973 [Daedaleopsis nitida]